MIRGVAAPAFNLHFNLPRGEDAHGAASSPRCGVAAGAAAATAAAATAPSVRVMASMGVQGAAVPRFQTGGLLPLLEVPARADECPSESVLKRQKFAAFEKACSRVAEGLFVSGEWVAKSREALAEHGITHVVNCVGAMYPEFWRDDGICYRTLWLTDLPSEDILCVLYDCFDFIEAARSGASNGGRPGSVLVHCSQGVSRSTTIVIAYLMWKLGRPYDEVYQSVRALRGVASPNIGFTCQLLQWQKRRDQPPLAGRAYQMTPHCSSSPGYLVPKALQPGQLQVTSEGHNLDGAGCYVLHTAKQVLVWRGGACPAALLEAGLRAAQQLERYEGAPPAEVVGPGEEPADFLAALQLCCLDSTRPSRAASIMSSGGGADLGRASLTGGTESARPSRGASTVGPERLGLS